MLEKIGKYDIAEQIGVGGFGAVYRGRDPHIKRTVAIKTCQVNDEEIKSRFFREAELAGNLHHRHITTIYDFGVENGIPYIVQEFLTGEDLDKKIKRADALSVARKLEIVMAIAEGLHYAHEAHIIHRDIKPANIRVLDDGNVKIMDFGIAKSLQSESSLTQTGITLGTSAYLAPEQIRGEDVDRRTDIFALGVLNYELLIYRKPFRGEHLSTVLYRILNEQPEPIASAAPDVPPALIAAVSRAMEKAMDKRYATMEDFRRDLYNVHRELTGGSGFYATPSGTVPPSPPEDLTLATPSRGVGTGRITPPSGALARVPAPADPTPTAGRAPARDGGLELVNFRDPGQGESDGVSARAAPPPRPPAARARWIAAGTAVLVLAAAAAVTLSRRKDPAPRPVPAAVRPTAAAAAPPAELPRPEVGVDAAPTAPARPPTAAPSTAPPVTARAEASSRRFPVQFSSIPPATLSVDGREIGPSVPAKVVELEQGTHRVRFSAPGLEPHEETVRVGANGAPPIAYQFPIGFLVIRADPTWAGASVIVDGKYKASLEGSGARVKLPPGPHRVILLREGFQPANREVTIEKGSEQNWSPPPAVSVELGGPGG